MWILNMGLLSGDLEAGYPLLSDQSLKVPKLLSVKHCKESNYPATSTKRLRPLFGRPYEGFSIFSIQQPNNHPKFKTRSF